MNKIFSLALLVTFLAAPAFAANYAMPTLDLEKKIAYQQGQFGALYERCGSADEKGVIGGSLAAWRSETFRGYNGSAAEHRALEQSFDEAANAVALDAGSCKEWVKQAAATWRGIVQLSQYGTPVALNR